jgi:hypothetical protein
MPSGDNRSKRQRERSRVVKEEAVAEAAKEDRGYGCLERVESLP